MKPDTARTAHDLGAALRRRRRALKLSQTDLAARAGTSQKTVSFAGAGEPGTKLQTIFDLLAALEVELLVRPRAAGGSASITDIF